MNYNHCNGSSYEDCVGKTTAVGTYPSGASPYVALDMAGNADEWCATKWVDSYKRYVEDNDLGGDTHRVARGGSFHNGGSGLHCAYRSGHPPTIRLISISFRVVASPVHL